MFIDYAINDISDPDEMASFEVDFKNGGSTSYWSSYNNPAAIKLVHQAQAEFNAGKRAALYARIQAIVAQDAPFVPLDYPPYIYAFAKQGPGLRGEPGRGLPSRGRLANLTRWSTVRLEAPALRGVRRDRSHGRHVPAPARRAGRSCAARPRTACVSAGDRLAAAPVGARQLAGEPVPAVRVERSLMAISGESYVNHTSALSLIGSRIGDHRLARRRRDVVLGAADRAAGGVRGLAQGPSCRSGRAGISVTGLGLPAFWFGIVLIEIFALRAPSAARSAAGETSFGRPPRGARPARPHRRRSRSCRSSSARCASG